VIALASKKNLLAVIAVVLVAGGAWWYWSAYRADEPAYREVVATRGDVELSILSTGVIQPRNRLEIKPPIAGRVETVLAEEGQQVTKGQILAWMSSTERAALMDAARARGPEELARWEELYRPTPILAPIRGTVILRNIEPGQTFTGADAVFVMSDRLTVKAQVDETDIAKIILKQKARVVLDAYPDQGMSAHVDQIAYDAKTVNNVTTYLVDVLPETTPAFMRSGMTASVAFRLDVRQGVVRVPSRAVSVRDDRSFVQVVAADGGREERAVQTGLSDGKFTEITEGLREGEKLLIAQLKSEKRSSGTNPFATPLSRPPQKK